MERCRQCMEPLENGAICSHCGFDNRQAQNIPYAIMPGTLLMGKYLIGNVLGQGGFGITYIGYDTMLQIKVAIKEYYVSSRASRTGGNGSSVYWTTEPGNMEHFLKEAQRMAVLDHMPEFAKVRDVFYANNTAYIIMEYVEGITLKKYLLKNGFFTYQQAVERMLPVIRALGQIHEKGLVHRDISPDNLMVEPNGRLRILDMGAAGDASQNDGEASQLVVRHGFSPYEQYVRNVKVDAKMDVYAVCATLYFCCTGQKIPNAHDRMQTYVQTKQTELDLDKSVPAEGAKVLQKGMALLAEKRIPNMNELEVQLEKSVKESKSVPPKPKPELPKAVPPKPEPLPKTSLPEDQTVVVRPSRQTSAQPPKRKPPVAILLAVLAVLAAVGMGVTLLSGKQQPTISVPATTEAITVPPITEPPTTELLTIEQLTKTTPLQRLTQCDYAYSDDPADSSAYTAEEFAQLVQQEDVRDYLPLGTRIKMVPNSAEITDTAIEFELVAYRHFRLADGSELAKTTWLMVDLLNEERQMNSKETNREGWKGSDLRQWLNETLYPSLPTYWQELIRCVEVRSTAGADSKTFVTSNDYLFLPSIGEVGSWNVTGYKMYQSEIDPEAEERMFSLFTDDASRIKRWNGEDEWWWLRSPAVSTFALFYIVINSGNSYSYYATISGGVCIGFCL